MTKLLAKIFTKESVVPPHHLLPADVANPERSTGLVDAPNHLRKVEVLYGSGDCAEAHC